MLNFDEYTLIERIQHGNTEAFNPLVQKYHHALILKEFGDIPQVRTVIEHEINRPNTGHTVTLTPLDKESIAYLERDHLSSSNAIPLAERRHTENIRTHEKNEATLLSRYG